MEKMIIKDTHIQTYLQMENGVIGEDIFFTNYFDNIVINEITFFNCYALITENNIEIRNEENDILLGTIGRDNIKKARFKREEIESETLEKTFF